ncbi:MAG: hypothetical protein ACOCV2_08600, partial [Persicimonas sp.]
WNGAHRSPARTEFSEATSGALNDTEKHPEGKSNGDGAGKADVAQTAEFDYVDDWSEEEDSEPDSKSNSQSDAPMAGLNPNRPARVGDRSKPPQDAEDGEQDESKEKVGGTVERALDGFDAFLDEESEPSAGSSADLSSSGLSSSGLRADNSGVGFESGNSQASGVFSRYDEATEAAPSGEFDLFEEDSGAAPREQTLQDIVNAHEKKIRRLKKRLAYQKEVVQVVSELLVEARVISRSQLKKRLRALRDKNS